MKKYKITRNILFVLFLFGLLKAEGQSYYEEYYLDVKTVFTCNFEGEIEPLGGSVMTGAEFIAYCEANQEDTNPAGRIYWNDEFDNLNVLFAPATFSAENLQVFIQNEKTESNAAYEFYNKRFIVDVVKDGHTYREYTFIQIYTCYLYYDDDPRIGDPLFGTFSRDNGKEGATVDEVEFITDIATFRQQNIDGFDPDDLYPIGCNKEDSRLIIRHGAPRLEESDDDCEAVFHISYAIYDAVLVSRMGYVVQSKVADIEETQTLHRKVHYSGMLRVKTFTTDEPPAVSNSELTRAYLENEGANIFSYCPDEELEIDVVGSDEVIREGEYLRTYYVAPKDCDDEDNRAFFTQRWLYRGTDIVPFQLGEIRDVSDEGANDGGATIVFPPTDVGCYTLIEPDVLAKIKQSYRVEWYNKKTEQNIVVYGDDPDVEDPFTIDRLSKGDWVVSVYVLCPDCDLYDDVPVFQDEFKIDEFETKLYVTIGVRLYAGWDNFMSAFGLHRYADDELPEGEEYEGDRYLYSLTNMPFPGDASGYTIDLLSQRNHYEWDVERGTFDFDHQLMVFQTDPNSSHTPFHEWVSNYEQKYGDHFVVAKGLSGSGMPRAFIFKRLDDEGKLRDITRKPVYTECLKDSSDPNEIFGPTGYTDADSTVVRMINATDNVGYTIQFENDPEFASAAAARVKITCPLDEHADPTTFRLGDFGFGNYTFEVPPMASYYNNRINMDSLGYWLDVTASIQVPGNVAYWIFQTIDPETGVAPIDSLGFLPVNDTLTGVGEGYVTFSVSPKPSANNNQIHTGDSIVEQADIYFDENEVVPTNRYKNVFDAVAPSSVIVCDTTGAHQTMLLNIGFNASDEDGGSGVRYIELYANVDMKGFERIAQIHPDSVLSYSLVNGSNFEFMGLAVDNVGNKEEYKPFSELTYSLGTPPYDLSLSNDTFEENDAIGTHIGDFSTFDDQNTDYFVYALVNGQGSDDNNLFSITGKELKTNFDFRCYGSYEYHIRVRTTDITNASLEKTFTIFANQTETIEPTLDYYYLCPGEQVYINGQPIAQEGVYFDTLSSYLGCDSVVRRIVRFNPTPITTVVDDAICFGEDYTENGFNLTQDSLTTLAQGWDMQSDYNLSIDNYVENAFGCYDTTRLALTIHPAFNAVDEVVVCPTDLPFEYQGATFYHDTVAVFRYETATDCDSTYTLRMTLNPDYGPQESEFTGGWNWYSTYIDQSNGRGLTELENALGSDAEMIKSRTGFVIYDSGLNTWYGGLDGINNTTMYMIKMTNPNNISITGCYADADTIWLAPGWTWIGYPLTESIGMNQFSQAIGGAPSDSDVIKSKHAFAMYYADYAMWFGLLYDMTPGTGYMYMSNSSVTKPLCYNNSSRTHDVHLLEASTPHWVVDHKQYANNMTMMGIISLDGQLIESDTLEVGAFVNGEERGAGRAVYIEELDAYRIFLTVHGEEGDVVNFRLYDHSRDKERRIRCQQQLTFVPNRHYGTLDDPYKFVFLTDYDKLIQAEICEGDYYTENNFHVFRQGTYFQELTTAMGNDSIVRLDLTVNPVYHFEETVVAMGFPFEYEGVVFDKPGTHVLPFQTAAACDSVWVVTLRPYEGERELLFSPQPASRSQRVNVFFPFTQQEQKGVVVEVYTLTGSLIQSKKPTRFPIELDPFTTAGTYMVKITMGTGEVITGKLIIK